MKASLILVAFLAVSGHLFVDAVDDFNAPVSRERRFSTQGCRSNPENNEEKIPEKGASQSLTCNLDSAVQTCTWTHYKPENEGRRTNDPDILCTGTTGQNGRPCETESRITFQQTSSTCGITITNTLPEDTGRWKLIAVGLTPSLSAQTTESEFKVYTYNESRTLMTDNRDNPITTLETSYNWNTKTEAWEPGKGDYENVEFKCHAYGGRPYPKFRWYIDNNNNDPILTNTDGFMISEGTTGGEASGYIKNFASRITFRIDQKLIDRLNKQSINTNPVNGVFSFELRCEVMQGNYVNPYRQSVRLNVKRTYDDGNLAAGTIGLIVGIVVAVLLVIVAIALLVFAKSSGRWCFADDEEAYRKPQEARPRTANSGQPTPTQQVYRKDQGVTKTETQPRSGPIRRNSSSASSTDHNMTTKINSNGKSAKTNGEWMGDTDSSSKPIIKKATAPIHRDSGRSSNSPSPSSVSSRSGDAGHAPPPRPYKPPDLQYANLDLSRSFMVDPRNRVLPSSQQQQPYAPPPQQFRQPTGPPQPTSYATIVSNSKIV